LIPFSTLAELINILDHFSDPSPKFFDVWRGIHLVLVELIHEFPTLIDILIRKLSFLEEIVNARDNMFSTLNLEKFHELIYDCGVDLVRVRCLLLLIVPVDFRELLLNFNYGLLLSVDGPL